MEVIVARDDHLVQKVVAQKNPILRKKIIRNDQNLVKEGIEVIDHVKVMKEIAKKNADRQTDARKIEQDVLETTAETVRLGRGADPEVVHHSAENAMNAHQLQKLQDVMLVD